LATNLVWHVLWRYSNGGKPLEQFPIQAADFIVAPLFDLDGVASPDPASVAAVIGNNFPAPSVSGFDNPADLVIVAISSAQSPVVFS
jgi:hypothetical protein